MYNIKTKRLLYYVEDLTLHPCMSESKIRTEHIDNSFSLAFLRKKRLRIGMHAVLF